MAEIFKNAKLSVPITTAETLYTCPSATSAIVQFCQASNNDTSSRTLTVSWIDSSDSNTETKLTNALSIPINTPALPIEAGFVLEAGDSIKAVSDGDDKITLTISVLEIS